VVYNSNPVAIAPDSEKVIAGFAREDLFTVVLEHFQTDTADYADYVLPATTQLEHFDVHKSYGHWYVMANHPAIAPVGQAKPNSEIFRLLARAMGWHEAEHFDSDLTLGAQTFDWNHPRLSHSSYAELLREGWIHLGIDKTTNPFAQGGFPTASGRCEFYSQSLADQGLDPLPNYLEPYEEPTSEFPLQMISPPARNFLNTSFVNVDSLRKNEPQPRAVVHPTDAAQRGIEQGAAVRLFNARGSCELIADVSERTRAGLVVVPSIWWHKLARGGRNVNVLTNQRLTDLGGGPTFYDCAVQIELL
jgi:anaerobic selenocysteine-containing dehydrogenase